MPQKWNATIRGRSRTGPRCDDLQGQNCGCQRSLLRFESGNRRWKSRLRRSRPLAKPASPHLVRATRPPVPWCLKPGWPPIPCENHFERALQFLHLGARYFRSEKSPRTGWAGFIRARSMGALAHFFRSTRNRANACRVAARSPYPSSSAQARSTNASARRTDSSTPKSAG
jgi:hypothetical protein